MVVAGLALSAMAGDITSGPKGKIGGAFDVKAITGDKKGTKLCYV
jgi:hypothetical protein